MRSRVSVGEGPVLPGPSRVRRPLLSPDATSPRPYSPSLSTARPPAAARVGSSRDGPCVGRGFFFMTRTPPCCFPRQSSRYASVAGRRGGRRQSGVSWGNRYVLGRSALDPGPRLPAPVSCPPTPPCSVPFDPPSPRTPPSYLCPPPLS